MKMLILICLLLASCVDGNKISGRDVTADRGANRYSVLSGGDFTIIEHTASTGEKFMIVTSMYGLWVQPLDVKVK